MSESCGQSLVERDHWSKVMMISNLQGRIGKKTSDFEGFELIGNRTIDSKHELLEDLLKARNHSGGYYFMPLSIQGLYRKNS